MRRPMFHMVLQIHAVGTDSLDLKAVAEVVPCPACDGEREVTTFTGNAPCPECGDTVTRLRAVLNEAQSHLEGRPMSQCAMGREL